jgi:alkylhydroperoxidase family enzyme
VQVAPVTDGARIPMLGLDEALAAGERAGVRPELARLNIFRVLLRRERAAKGAAEMLLGLIFGGALDARLRELVIMRIGWATGSVYEWTQHWRIASDLGVDGADLLGVRDWLSSDRFGELDRAVLAATDQCLAGGRVDDATWSVLRRHLGDDEAVELVVAIGLWWMVSTVLRSLDVPLEDDLAAWPPDGVGP